MKSGKIYFLRRQDGLIKIGFSANLQQRFASLSKSHGPLEVIRVINGSVAREHQLHNAAKRCHEYGEWFRDCDELRQIIVHCEDGEIVPFTKSEAKRRWSEGEREFAAKARERVVRLLQIRKQRTGARDIDCLKAIDAEYGIGVSFMRHLIDREPASVGAYAFSRLHAALIDEMEQYAAELQTEMSLVEAGEQIPERTERKRYEREARRLAARIQEKKAARAAR